jgi:ABC-type enterobactin transport system permease subunit
MVAVESLYLMALLSAFVGLIAMMVLSAPDIARADVKKLLVGVIVAASIVSVGSLFLYALSPHAVARSVYGSTSATSIQI